MLRGFYDDNVGTLPNSQAVPAGFHRDTYGFEVSPTASLNWALEQTTINLGAMYSLKEYGNRPPFSADDIDHTFTFNAGLSHAFNERYQLKVSDSFVLGQEPDTLRAGNTFSTFQRLSGDNIRNYGAISFDAQLTPQFGVNVGYDNAYYNYSNDQIGIDGVGNVLASSAGLLNRLENGAHVEGLWSLQPETKAIFGYRFHQIDYIGDQVVFGNVLAPASLGKSELRNVRSHTVYVGAQHSFTPELAGDVRVGGSYYDYFNTDSTDWAPYVAGNLSYTYAPECSVSGGVSYERSATDLIGFNGASFTTDADTAAVYLAINHKIASKLYGNLTGQFQYNTYNSGSFGDQDEQYYLLGANLEYRFNQYFSANAGYNYDRLESGLKNFDRSYDRNRVYIGFTARY